MDEPLDSVEFGSETGVANGEGYALCKINSNVEACFPVIDKGKMYHFFTCGHWSTHELLYYIITKTGPAEVLFCTWSISENAARLLVDMLDKGMITNLRAVLDFRSKNRHPSAYQLAKHSFSDLHTFVCHAKVTIIRNADWCVTINGSANYTNNPRPEAGYVDTTEATADFYTKYIEQMLNKGNPFE